MNPMKEDVEFLEHFGVKGMRWGVRKDRSPVQDGAVFVRSLMRQIGQTKKSDLPNLKTLQYSHGVQILNFIQNVLDATS